MNENDTKITSILEKIADKEKSLAKVKRHVLNTNGVFKYDDGSFFNLNTVSDVNVIVSAFALILQKQMSHAEAEKRLGVKGAVFSHCGYSVDDWEDDFKNRLDIVKFTKEKKTLEEAKKALEVLLSTETKTSKAIDDVLKNLGV